MTLVELGILKVFVWFNLTFDSVLGRWLLIFLPIKFYFFQIIWWRRLLLDTHICNNKIILRARKVSFIDPFLLATHHTIIHNKNLDLYNQSDKYQNKLFFSKKVKEVGSDNSNGYKWPLMFCKTKWHLKTWPWFSKIKLISGFTWDSCGRVPLNKLLIIVIETVLVAILFMIYEGRLRASIHL